MKKLVLLTILAAVVLVPTASAAVALSGAKAALADRDLTLADMLTYALQDERIARTEYQVILDVRVFPPFSNIKAEESHIRTRPVRRQQAQVPPTTRRRGAEGRLPPSRRRAEIDNIAMYDRLLALNLPADVRQCSSARRRRRTTCAPSPTTAPAAGRLEHGTKGEHMKKPKSRWRLAVQIIFFVLVAAISANNALKVAGVSIPVLSSASLHAICPFGGVVSIYQVATAGTYVQKVHAASFILMIIAFLVTLLFGPAFCGWLCPMGSIQEWFGKLGRKILGRRYNGPSPEARPGAFGTCATRCSPGCCT
jgi:hypothetical protein